jgi:hypothetical protein
VGASNGTGNLANSAIISNVSEAEMGGPVAVFNKTFVRIRGSNNETGG